MVESKPKQAALPQDLEAAFTAYSKAAGDLVLKLCRIAGVPEEDAIKFALSEKMIDMVALNLHAITSHTICILKAEINKGANHADL